MVVSWFGLFRCLVVVFGGLVAVLVDVGPVLMIVSFLVTFATTLLVLSALAGAFAGSKIGAGSVALAGLSVCVAISSIRLWTPAIVGGIALVELPLGLPILVAIGLIFLFVDLFMLILVILRRLTALVPFLPFLLSVFRLIVFRSCLLFLSPFFFCVSGRVVECVVLWL